jgi:AsmA protein
MISLRDVALIGGNETLRVDLESSLEGDRLDIHQLTARAARTQLRGTGVVRSLSRLEADFDAAADPLDLDEVIAIGSAFTTTAPSAGSGGGMPMHISVKLTAPTGQFASYDFRDLSSTVDIIPTRLVLSPLAVRTFGGSFNGRLEVDSRGRTPELRLTGRLESLDVAQLLKASGSPGGLTGTLGGTLSLNGEGSDTATLLRTSRGTIAAAITDGTLPHLDMVRTIVLAFGKPSGAPAEGSGSAFSRLGGTFGLAGGILTSNALVMASRDFEMAGKGTLRIATGDVDARADVVLSRELTAQAGTDLRRYAQQEGRVVVPVTISGTLQNPHVSPDLAAAASRALGNELKRRATSFLEGLFKKKD